jgi:hypothetical protein
VERSGAIWNKTWIFYAELTLKKHRNSPVDTCYGTFFIDQWICSFLERKAVARLVC